ncbi:hypothetical protein ACF1BB_01140 [Streptomyces griseoluteus]|uniref:hypothetical protein n=1 Tax=Streptomyces griseoluteus TaxID=29306 RepID=UPI0036FF10A1
MAATLRRPEALDDLRAQHGGRLWTAGLDVTGTARTGQVLAAAFAPRLPGHRPPMPEYAATPAGETRRALTDGTFVLPDAPEKITQAVIDLVDSGATPLRLPLGSDTYDGSRASLTARPAEHDAHRDTAYPVVSEEIDAAYEQR